MSVGNYRIGYLLEPKNFLHVWCKQPRGKWGLGRIQSTSGVQASVSLSNGNVMRVAQTDLLQLSYLNEPSVLHNLRFRYSQDMIYSKVGPILIALNPFKDVQIYGNDYVSAYRI
ncbi:myosin heavy chain [Medicago truncatula]|uniref:Myosin heavy chain n=1 Tax=Medicago truncatula TaxID=3880 RepID=G7KIR4_MEDTR|nr:myosin heavy chain [Medicago truncatula]